MGTSICDVNGLKENIILYLCEDAIEKSVPSDHRCKPRAAKRLSSGRNFLSNPHTHDGLSYSRLFVDSL